MNDLSRASILLKQGHAAMVLGAVRRRIYSNGLAFGLHRNLTRSFKTAQAKIPVTIRPLASVDHAAIRAAYHASTAGQDTAELMARLQMIEAGIATCYAAVDSDDNLCYMQWLIRSEDNDLVQSYFRGAVPRLKPNEALIEGAYALRQYRGLGIMACAMAQIAERAADFGAEWVVTFVGHDNVPSLKGCRCAGFEPFLVRKECWRLLRRNFVFELMPVRRGLPLINGGTH